jgi:hypothetical protein
VCVVHCVQCSTMDQVRLAMLFLAFLMLDLKNIVQNVSDVFTFFAKGNREADFYCILYTLYSVH